MLPYFQVASALKQLRHELGYPAKYVTEILKSNGITISEKTLYGYESGLSMPNADVFITLCKIYECDNPMALFEGEFHVSDYDSQLTSLIRELNEEGIEKLIDYADDLVASGKYIKSGQNKLGKTSDG